MERRTVGALVIESVSFKSARSTEPVMVRVSDRLALHEGVDPHIIPLLNHALAAGPPPDLVHASIEFLLDGAAYLWRADFDMNSYELTNRSTNETLMGLDKVGAHLDRILPRDTRAREAAFQVPAPVVADESQREYGHDDPPPSDALTAELALCETQLRKASQASLTATALYSELFPLLESMEVFTHELQAKVTQLSRNAAAEEAFAELDLLEAEQRKQIEAGRSARALEKEIAAYSEQIKGLKAIEDPLLQNAREASTAVDSIRRLFLEAEQLKKQIHDRLAKSKPARGWITGGLGALVVIAAMQLEATTSFADYIWITGVVLLLALPWAALQTARKSALLRTQKICSETWTQRRRDLEVAELTLLQLLRPHSARDITHLKQLASEQVETLARLEAMSTRLAELRVISKTDDAVSRHSATETAVLADTQERCRMLASYRLDPADRDTIAKQVEDLRMDATARKQAAMVLKEECKALQSGWSDVSVLAERVAKLQMRLSEWRRWEKAFRALNDVIDGLPNVPDAHDDKDDSPIELYLKRISAGRWSRLLYDSDSGIYKVFDHEADLWVHADPDNPTIISSVNLACRLGMLDREPQSSRMPLWLVEPFNELPDLMARATAELLAEVSEGRQVVMLCRRMPAVSWPPGVTPQT